MDYVLIEELLVRCIIGVNEDERREKQDVLIDITLGHDSRKAGKTDDFANALDYRAIKKRVLTMAEASEFFLVEALAERIAEICLGNPLVLEAEVTVRKPSALRFARNVGIRIHRSREA